jgi:hypothetical protein
MQMVAPLARSAHRVINHDSLRVLALASTVVVDDA